MNLASAQSSSLVVGQNWFYLKAQQPTPYLTAMSRFAVQCLWARIAGRYLLRFYFRETGSISRETSIETKQKKRKKKTTLGSVQIAALFVRAVP